MKKIYKTKYLKNNLMGIFSRQNAMKNILVTAVLLCIFTSCEDYFEPAETNERDFNELISNPNSTLGLLIYGYRSIPGSYDSFGGDFLDSATDNALSNQLSGTANKTVEINGFWSPVNGNNILNAWRSRYDELKNVNQFLEIGLEPSVLYYKADLERDEKYRQRLKGEAFFLRAWIHFDLLRRYAGIDSNGQLMGIPLLTSTLNINGDDLDIPRNTYQECVQQISDDLDIAIANLPVDYNGVGEDFDNTNLGRPTTVACQALKSRLLLYAASPSYGTSEFSEAAQAAFETIEVIGSTLPNGIYDSSNNVSSTFFNNDENSELIMRRVSTGQAGNRNLETNHFPPGNLLLGDGRCNPTQNLVDAFPMANGYPITESTSGYVENLMYENRDPRLEMTVIRNNQVFKGQTVETFEGGNNISGGSDDNVTIENSTRTGYYLRKWMSSKANLVEVDLVSDIHYYALFRKVEIFLNLAEAANEAYGPDGGAIGMTAREAIAEVRRRAGIASGGTDDYLASISTKEAMRDLIKNERRIELCFEGHRFYDLRRWEDNLNEPITGITITKNTDDTFSFQRKTIVTPSFAEYMNYGPLPFDELLRTENITQNQGW